MMTPAQQPPPPADTPVDPEPQFDRRSAVNDTLARARAARTRRQLGTASPPAEAVDLPPPPVAAPRAESSYNGYGAAPDGAPSGGGSGPAADTQYHPHAERRLQRLREREAVAAVQQSGHRAAMSVIATVPDPGTRRQALRTMSASARVAALLTMPDKEVQQIQTAKSRPVGVAMAFAAVAAADTRDDAAAAATLGGGAEDAPLLVHPGPLFSPHAARPGLALARRDKSPPLTDQDEWIENLRRKHAQASPVVGLAREARARGGTAAGGASLFATGPGLGGLGARLAAAGGGEEPGGAAETPGWKAKAIAMEDELRSKTGELQGLHAEIELMLSHFQQVTQERDTLSHRVGELEVQIHAIHGKQRSHFSCPAICF